MSDLGRNDDPRALSTLLVGVVGIALVAVTVLLLEALHRRTEHAELYRKVVLEEPVELNESRAAQAETLSEYGWIDREQGVVAVPIERAMELVVEEAQP